MEFTFQMRQIKEIIKIIQDYESGQYSFRQSIKKDKKAI